MSIASAHNQQTGTPYFCRLNCLQFTGNSYNYRFSGIDTLVDMSKIGTLTMKVDWRNACPDYREICGGDTSGSYSFEVGKNGKYGLGAANYSTMSPSEVDTIVWKRTISEKPTLHINGVYATTDQLLREPIGTFKIPVSLSFTVNMKLFSLRLEGHDGSVLFDGFPVQFLNDTGDFEAGLFDKVSGNIFANVGNVPFALDD